MRKLSKKIKSILRRVFGRSHPDIYTAVKDYAEKKGLDVGDVVAAAVSAYLASDAEGKEALEKAVAESRSVKSGGGGANLKVAINLFKEMCGAMGELFTTMNEARSKLSAASLIADYKAVTEAAQQIKKLGSESGSGTLEDTIATIFLQNLLGGKLPKVKSRKPTGQAPVEKIGED